MHVRPQGFFHVEKRKAASGLVVGQWDFHNNITDTGLDLMANAADFAYGIAYFANACQVGSGNTAPANTDTVLVSPIASKGADDGADGSGTKSYVAGPPAYWKIVRTFTFGTGAAAGNLAEIGIYCGQTGATRLFCRELIRDGSGNPTTITVLSDEILVVTYELRFYLDTTDVAGTINIDGTDYSYTQRLMDIDNIPNLQNALGQNSDSNTVAIAAYAGDIGTTTTVPSGQMANRGASFDAYTSGNYYVDVYTTFSISQANTAGGIKAFSVSGPFHKYQLSFAANPIMKTSGQQLTIRFRLSWGRYAP